MPEHIFQCVDANNNLEACKDCGSFDFKNRQTLSTAIVCAKCEKFHKTPNPSIKSAGEIFSGMMEFQRKHGE